MSNGDLISPTQNILLASYRGIRPPDVVKLELIKSKIITPAIFMDFEPQETPQEFAESPLNRKPLQLLRDTEALLRRPTVSALTPILPTKLSQSLGEASLIAEETLQELAKIDIDEITDFDLRSARIYVGLSFVGFGALMLVILLLYLQTLHPEMNASEQIFHYWYEYIWFVNLGVAGMFVLGREAMRPVQKISKNKKTYL